MVLMRTAYCGFNLCSFLTKSIRTRGDKSTVNLPGTSTDPTSYSPNLVEGPFCEVRMQDPA
jgi:hypothetical protein